MRILVPVVFALALPVWAQQAPSPETVEKMKAAAQDAVQSGKSGVQQVNPQAPQAPKRTMEVTVPAQNVLPISALPPDTVIATANGEKVTAGQLQAVLQSLPPQMQQQAQSNRKAFVEQYVLLKLLTEQAKKARLDEQSPWKQAIDYGIMRVLSQAAMSKKVDEFIITNDEIKQAYDGNKDKYVQAKVKAIYVPFTTAPVSQADANGKKMLTEAEAKAKAEDLMKQAKAGADFVKLVKENSGDPNTVAKDGDYGFIKKTDQIPNDLKSAIFTAKAGDIAGPVRQPNGFYVFRIEELGAQPFDQVSLSIMNEIKTRRFQEWMSGLQKTIDVKLETLPVTTREVPPQQGGLTAPPAANAPAAPNK